VLQNNKFYGNSAAAGGAVYFNAMFSVGDMFGTNNFSSNAATMGPILF